MKRTIFLLILALSIFITACGNEATETHVVTSTPDPCSSANLSAEVTKVNKLMREFDDYATLASNTPQAQLVVVIPDLQRVLREAENQALPACLEALKKLQLTHMNIVVQTLMAFMSSSDLDAVNTGITHARDSHNQYDMELARLLGVTVAPLPTSMPTP